MGHRGGEVKNVDLLGVGGGGDKSCISNSLLNIPKPGNLHILVFNVLYLTSWNFFSSYFSVLLYLHPAIL